MKKTPSDRTADLVVIATPTPSEFAKRYELVGACTIGRSKQASVVIAGDDGVSRVHCHLEPTDSGWVVRDLGSLHGVRADGEWISEPHELRDGSTLTLGQTTFKFLDSASRAPRMRPASVMVVSGSELGNWRVLDDSTPVTIGCGPEADWEIEDPSRQMSRVHCRLEPVDGGWVILDLDSATGAAVAGEVITGARRLRTRDTITLGEVQLRFTGQRQVDDGGIHRQQRDGLTRTMSKWYTSSTRI